MHDVAYNNTLYLLSLFAQPSILLLMVISLFVCELYALITMSDIVNESVVLCWHGNFFNHSNGEIKFGELICCKSHS